MPRPGPRPYECVRRAWHSERHQPIRGSLIQEIFRVVNEIHSPATKKNKEWQEKLPIVVLKAEEIMYSKANSEAEYMDLKTILDRINDAIRTIIRLDESSETGEFLHPCIEAALNLGCTPRRASRSQRNSNPGCYLKTGTLEPTCVPLSNFENIVQANLITNATFMSHNLNFMKPATMNGGTLLGSDSHGPLPQNRAHTSNKFLVLPENFPPFGTLLSLPKEIYASPNWSVYPLYYVNQLQSQESNFGPYVPLNFTSNKAKPAATGNSQNPNVDASNKFPRAELRGGGAPENPPRGDCDLSLRLGPLSESCVSMNNWPQEVEDVGSNSSQGRSRLSETMQLMDKEFSFFPKPNASDPLDSCSSKWSSEAEKMKADTTTKKRKAVFSYQFEDRQFCWQPKHQYYHSTEKMSNAGL
ncbi:uncharacterized protein LOC127813475 [Diospyros lotus]|uniref:uncharacterized protein LOC127813475 n=1 Tax=Diospyros lotus TaxID=55363 RepID=UPI002259C688|nr:uncharacterized protein LOC127813475 [Diospyros lotus]